MKLIAFTRPVFFAGEADILTSLLPATDACHLRKEASAPEAAWRALLGALPGSLRHKVWLHGFYELAPEYGLEGVHLNRHVLAGSRDAEALIGQWQSRGLRVSVTCHYPGEVDRYRHLADRVLIAPVFDSLSKPGHQAAWDPTSWSVPGGSRAEFVALGGVDTGHIPVLSRAGFDGVAVLGALWQASDPEEKILELKTACTSKALTY